jgi:Carboxypeptidase regulatory-like domain
MESLCNPSLAAGQLVTGVLFKLARTASITGRAMDEDGQPLPNVEVKVYQTSRRNGRGQLGAVGGASTNDLGEYRVFDLAPGRYYVRANCHAWKDAMGIKPSSSQSSKESYPPTFYLNTADPLKAAPIIVNAGDEIPSVDFLLKPTGAHLG